MSWTEEIIQKTVTAWDKGDSAGFIAKHVLGGEKSRNSIVGWIHRNQDKVTRKTGQSIFRGGERVKIKRKLRKKVNRLVMRPIRKAAHPKSAPVISHGVSLFDRQDYQCCHVITNVPIGEGYNHLYCGLQKIEGSSYCQAHADLCYKAKTRKRSNSPVKTRRIEIVEKAA